MKFLGRVLFGFVVIIIGLNVFTQSRNFAYTKSIGLNGDTAITEGNYDYFKGLRGYYLTTDILNETVSTEDMSYNLHAFLQSNGDFNVMTVIVDNLEGIETSDGNDVQALSIKVTGTGGNFEQQLVKIGKNNWLIQYVFLENLYPGQPKLRDDILDVAIWYQPNVAEADIIPLYDYDETQGPLLTAQESNLAAIISGLNHLDHNPAKLIAKADAVAATPTEQAKGTSKIYKEVVVRVRAPKDVTGDAYLSGNFNNWAEADNNYKLTYKEASKTLEGKFNITTDYTALQYKINFANNLVEVDELNQEVLHTHELLSPETVNLADYDITKVDAYKFNEYNSLVWRNMAIFGAIAAAITYLLFFRKRKSSKNVYTKQAVKPETVTKKSDQNLNLKKISDVEQRDSDYEAAPTEVIEAKVEENKVE